MIFAILDPGTLAGWLTFLIAAVIALLVYKGGGGAALSTLQTANAVLEKRVQDLEGKLTTAEATIRGLEAKTDISQAIIPLIDVVTQHEEQAQSRYVQTIEVLRVMTERMRN